MLFVKREDSQFEFISLKDLLIQLIIFITLLKKSQSK